MVYLEHDNIKGSRPEWCISSMICSGDTPFWWKTLDICLGMQTCTVPVQIHGSFSSSLCRCVGGFVVKVLTLSVGSCG